MNKKQRLKCILHIIKTMGLTISWKDIIETKGIKKIIYQLNLTELKTKGFVNLILIKFSFCYKI